MKQVGGTHYMDMGIDPFTFAMKNNWDAGAFSILKYLSRHAAKAGGQDVLKAMHFTEMRDKFLADSGVNFEVFNHISMDQYIKANNFDNVTQIALRDLESFVLKKAASVGLKLAINAILRDYEGGQQEDLRL